ncbi:sensor histidine kinase [Streptomyces sp. NPDC019890]|uniref:sensor histidine kinase n=1 Tax=Streptomyces sp. NPDC019890 TaxID=3365064 RepID=UPI00384BA168
MTTIRERPAFVWGIRAMRVAGLVALLATTSAAQPHPGWHGRQLAISCALIVAAVGWVGWLLNERHMRVTTAALATMALSGGLLGGLTPHSPAIAVAAVAALAAGGVLKTEVSIAIAVGAALALTASVLTVGGSTATMLGYLVLIGAGLGAGFIRLGYTQRADQAELLLAQTQRARQAEAHAAALAERTRIAREIHDILAHTLGGLALQLEAARALLAADSLPSGDPSLAKAIGCVDSAGQLTREGLSETRRAVHALREDTTSLPDLLTALIGTRRSADEKVRLSLHISGTWRRIEADATLALYRTAQEALSNAAKHAPGQPVALTLDYAPDRVRLTAVNPLPDTTTPRPLGTTGGGWGLTGLRERAELTGGTLTAGATDGGWRVCVTIPT